MSSIRRVRLAEEEKFVPKSEVVPLKDVEVTPTTAHTTVPSEIQADAELDGINNPFEHREIKSLAPSLQKHVMTAEERSNDPEYKFYVLNRDGTRIRHGWVNLEDAKEAVKDDVPGSCGKILQKRGLKALGIDPDDNGFWKVDEARSATKKPQMIGRELKSNWNYLASSEGVEARDDIQYSTEKSGEDEEK